MNFFSKNKWQEKKPTILLHSIRWYVRNRVANNIDNKWSLINSLIIPTQAKATHSPERELFGFRV